ncbi:hypothetical protein [Borrelia sp. P9F1]|uniref:hypothetical protein n=1 Tax=Borrelia sp. P9F1 TaxID=3058374 RepID=UPI0026488F4B|nr:hypothetical protein [Borrelia sp. P9F1]WKC58686.1 hypothetical protein QYZ68_05640 [Borrelia sp. P9F1]
MSAVSGTSEAYTDPDTTDRVDDEAGAGNVDAEVFDKFAIVSKEALFHRLKTKIYRHREKMDSLRTNFGSVAEQNKIEVPAGVRVLSDGDQFRIQASLDCNTKAIKNLNTVIKALKLDSGGKDTEIETVNEILGLLSSMDQESTDLFYECLEYRILEKIKDDRTKIEQVDAEIETFISAMYGLKGFFREIIDTASLNPFDITFVKTELERINDLRTATTKEYGYRQDMIESLVNVKKHLGLFSA